MPIPAVHLDQPPEAYPSAARRRPGWSRLTETALSTAADKIRLLRTPGPAPSADHTPTTPGGLPAQEPTP